MQKLKDMQEHSNKVAQEKGKKKPAIAFEKKPQIAQSISKAVHSNHCY